MSSQAPASVLTFVTTIHVALLVLLKHRRAPRGARLLLLLPSLLLVGTPWLLPGAGWLAVALAAHVAWLLACEKVVGAPATAGRGRPTGGRSAGSAKGPTGPHEVKVLATVDETPEIRTIRMERPAGFRFKAGQFLMVRVPDGGRTHVRCYSISSAPEAADRLEISVRRQGLVSGLLHERVRAGGSLAIQGPGGRFVYPEGPEPLVLLAAGVGITPVISMLRHALAAEPGRSVTLLYGVRTPADVAYREELAGLAASRPSFRLVVAVSRGAAPPGFRAGRLDAALVAETVARPGEAVYAICGPGPMIETMRAALRGLGVPDARVGYEAFEAAVAEAKGAAGEPGSPHEVRFSRSARTATAGPADSLLDVAESAGVEIASMCRAGVCGTCRTRLLEGAVDGHGEGLDPADADAGYVLACVSRPRAACVVDA